MVQRALLSFLPVALLATTAPPDPADKPATARWMAHNIAWGVLGTISTRSEGSKVGDAFGNPYSFADVSGVPYFYASDMDSSMIDLDLDSASGKRGSLSISEASLGSEIKACDIASPPLGDPENPPCARLVLSGAMSKVKANTSEEATAKAALFAVHPSFKLYPTSHEFFVAKMDVDSIWLIDAYGGPAYVAPRDYFNVNDSKPAVAPSASWSHGQPAGPSAKALCPVTGTSVNITSKTATVEFNNGQKLYFSSEEAAKEYRTSPRDFWLAPHDTPLSGVDGARGLPDLRGAHVQCPMSGENMTISMRTPRVDHKHGQAVYFCCHGCITAFWRDPESLFA
mmetsp:Transcript_25613/g.49865  ORF Transcript_25613/g.49865 Transcript_25613/m.49865 type:complete len:340 (-) Transcript_25613:211-1230(-)